MISRKGYLMGFPSVFPTSVTIYDPAKAASGYTVLFAARGVLLIDMNGGERHHWTGFAGNPGQFLPGGSILGFTSEDVPAQADWEGHVIWQPDIQNEQARAAIIRGRRSCGRAGEPLYWAPHVGSPSGDGNTLVLTEEEVADPRISARTLRDSKLLVVGTDGQALWQWRASEHFDEFGFDEAAKNALYRLPSECPLHGGQGRWLDIDSARFLGPNRWFDGGDARFHPDNIFFSARNANIIGIVSRETGRIVWRLGPNFCAGEAALPCGGPESGNTPKELGWIIGPHDAHLIPCGLPGEGNLLLFDCGGSAGYGLPNGTSPDGTANQHRDYSRVLELNPETLEIVWQYTPGEAGHVEPLDSYKFYSSLSGAAQRLPNGNTLITEGSDGRVFEVTAEHETVWEYVYPDLCGDERGLLSNAVFHARRVPYSWAPLPEQPRETPVVPPNVTNFRVPGSPHGEGKGKVTAVQGVDPQRKKAVRDPHVQPKAGESEERDFCVVTPKKQ